LQPCARRIDRELHAAAVGLALSSLGRSFLPQARRLLSDLSAALVEIQETWSAATTTRSQLSPAAQALHDLILSRAGARAVEHERPR
jgi:hypothetical protein